MARIKDLIAAIVSGVDGCEDLIRVITAAGHSAKTLRNAALAAELNLVSVEGDHAAIKAMAEQGVDYKRINLKSVTLPNGVSQLNASQSNIAGRTRKFLHELQIRGELNYPFFVIDSHCILLISAIDFDIVMAIAREQQMQESDPSIASQSFKRMSAIVPPE